MESLKDDHVQNVASFLSAPDLVRLGRTCKRFGGKPGGGEEDGTKDGNSIAKRATARRRRRGRKRKKGVADADGATAPVSFIDGFARRCVLRNEKEEWKHLLSKKRGESWTAVYDRCLQLRTSLAFVDFLGSGLQHVDNDLACVKARRKKWSRWNSSHSWFTLMDYYNYGQLKPHEATIATAQCQEVMRSGKHCATFTVVWPGEDIQIGIVRPLPWSEDEGEKKKRGFYNPHREVGSFHDARYAGRTHCCLFSLSERRVIRNGHPSLGWCLGWSKSELMEVGKRITLFLDLDEGEMEAYVGDEQRLVGPKISGLAGEYCWASVVVAMQSRDERGVRFWDETSVHVERLPPIPGS